MFGKCTSFVSEVQAQLPDNLVCAENPIQDEELLKMIDARILQLQKITIESQQLQSHVQKGDFFYELSNFCVGFDFGGVICQKEEEAPEVFPSIRKIITLVGAERVFIVSKAREAMQKRTMEWMNTKNFFEETGFSRKNIFFCYERKDKAGICRSHNITHFIDDRIDVLQFMNK